VSQNVIFIILWEVQIYLQFYGILSPQTYLKYFTEQIFPQFDVKICNQSQLVPRWKKGSMGKGGPGEQLLFRKLFRNSFANKTIGGIRAPICSVSLIKHQTQYSLELGIRLKVLSNEN
jgi:hypothetical protein